MTITEIVLNYGQVIKQSAYYSLISALKFVLTVVAIMFFIFLVIYFVSYLVIRNKQHQRMGGDLQDILREGRINVKLNGLRNLFTSVENNKLVNVGKIISFVRVKDNLKATNFSAIFAVKSGVYDIKFYKVKEKDYDSLSGDVILRNWNYKVKGDGRFLELNEDINIEEMSDKYEAIGVDTLKKLSPLVHSSILANAYHRIKLREKKLIKMPDEGGESAKH